MAESDRRRNLAFSSEYPVKRWFGTEILDHDPKSVRMKFMNSGRAPLLMGHDQRRVVGVIEAARVDKDKMGRAVTRFGRGELASDAMRDVDDGILVNVSTGYRVHEMVLEKSTDTEDTYRITDWEPLEASLVGIPADPDVGVERGWKSAPEIREEETEVRIIAVSETQSTTAQTAERSLMTGAAAAAAAEQNADKLTALQVERQRRDAILAFV
jgi:HK97 family phage prohead protease